MLYAKSEWTVTPLYSRAMPGRMKIGEKGMTYLFIHLQACNATESIHYRQHICEVLYSPECRQTFRSIKEDVLCGLTEGYLSIIENLIKDLERIFPLPE
jgi:hypothetical protein